MLFRGRCQVTNADLTIMSVARSHFLPCWTLSSDMQVLPEPNREPRLKNPRRARSAALRKGSTRLKRIAPSGALSS